MSANVNSTMYDAIPAVSELNKVPGFNPLKFLRKTDDGPKLDLKYKKLWFRLRYPSGRTKLTALRITEQLAIIEAKVYFDKNDPSPNGSYIATRYAQSTPGGLYIEAAQHDAMDTALSDAGFGLQFLSADPKEVTKARIADALNKQAGPVPPTEKDVPTVMENAATTEETPSAPTVAEAPASHAEKAEPATAMEAPAPHEEEHTPTVQNAIPAPTPVHAESTAAPADQPDNLFEAPAVYTADMPVDDICAVMTIEEAGDVIVPVGTCKGWTLSQVADRRPASLKWYLNGYNGDDNILRAGAKLMLAAISSVEKAS